MGPENSEYPKGSIKELKFVELEDPSVQLGFERLGRLLQIKNKKLDDIEELILGGRYKLN